MFKTITVPADELAAVVRNGRFEKLLRPGFHGVWEGFTYVQFTVIRPGDIVQRVEPGDPVPVALEGAQDLVVARNERALIEVDGRIRSMLDPGRFRVWVSAADVTITVIDVLAKPEPLPSSDRLSALKAQRFTERTASAAQAVILYEDGAPIEVLADGRYRAWDGGPWALSSQSLELKTLEIAVQDVMTADEVSVRLRPAVAYRVVDALAAVSEPNGVEHIYSAVQLALREIVASRGLDALISERQALSDQLRDRAAEMLPNVGLQIELAFVKDITLSAEVKAMISQVVVARKQAEALAIRRREEVASTRQQANTAKVLASNPVLMRLRELEAMSEIAGKIDKVVVMGGVGFADGLMRLSE